MQICLIRISLYLLDDLSFSVSHTWRRSIAILCRGTSTLGSARQMMHDYNKLTDIQCA